VQGVFDQEGGELTFTHADTSHLQVDGGRLNLTNAVVTGVNMYLGGTNDSRVHHESALVNLNSLWLGYGPGMFSSNQGTYVLQNGWLIVSGHAFVGYYGFGTLIQNGGTNSMADVTVGNGHYVKSGGGLFVGEVRVLGSTAPGSDLGAMSYEAGTGFITNRLRLVGQDGKQAHFTMTGGALTTRRIEIQQLGRVTHWDGTLQVTEELFIEDRESGHYGLYGGTLLSARSTISHISMSSQYMAPSQFSQGGGTHIVSGHLTMNGNARYLLSGGTVTAPDIVLTGELGDPPQFWVSGAPPYRVNNDRITLTGGAVVMDNSAQQFGHLTLTTDSGINLAGSAAIVRFADSHTNSWQWFGQTPVIKVYNWNGTTNGGGADQLSFGTDGTGLTASQAAQIQFINPAGFAPGTYPGRILATGEVVPVGQVPAGALSYQYNGTQLVLSWPAGFRLQSAINVVGPYNDVTNVSPYSVDVNRLPMEFFRLSN
jgi:hypothetical protein